jgi:putative methionine-R-sulfoxide reductase with GAF domain
MRFEVFIPGKVEDDFDITLKVKANSWLEALKSGLAKLGEDSNLMKHIMIDIMDDNSFHITETLNHRVFRIRELLEEEPKKEVVKEKPIEPKEVVEPQEELKEVVKDESKEVVKDEPKEVVKEKEVVKDKSKEVVKEVIKEIQKPIYKKVEIKKFEIPKKEVVKDEPKKEVVKDEPKKEAPKKVTLEIEDIIKSPTIKIELGRKREDTKNIDGILEELYFDISAIDMQQDVLKAMEMIMDFSMQYIDCESGSTYLVDMDKNDFYFAAIRGPKADLLRSLNLRIPVGVGIAGFSIIENLSLAISDVNRDPRFYKAISDKLGYPTYSMVCIPMHANGRVYGAIQLINKTKNNTFTVGELNILDYIASHAAKYLDRKFNILNNFS